jgi:hypothetical protein
VWECECGKKKPSLKWKLLFIVMCKTTILQRTIASLSSSLFPHTHRNITQIYAIFMVASASMCKLFAVPERACNYSYLCCHNEVFSERFFFLSKYKWRLLALSAFAPVSEKF